MLFHFIFNICSYIQLIWVAYNFFYLYIFILNIKWISYLYLFSFIQTKLSANITYSNEIQPIRFDRYIKQVITIYRPIT